MIQLNLTRSPALDPTANLPVRSSRAAQEAARRSLVMGLTATLLAEAGTRSVAGASGTGRLRILATAVAPNIDRDTVTLDEIASDPDLARLVSPEVAAALILKCAAVLSALATVEYQPNTTTAPAQRDELLTVAEAADRLSMSKDWVYRHAGKLPFAVRQGRALRFSSHGIDDYIRVRRMK